LAYRLTRNQRVARPREEVFAFFTDAANLALLCTAHHDLVHHGRWTVRFTGSRASLHPPTGRGP